MLPAACHSAPNRLGPEHQEHLSPFPCCFEPRPPSPLVTSLRDTACVRAPACPQGTLQLRVCSGRGAGVEKTPVRSSHPNVSLLAGHRGLSWEPSHTRRVGTQLFRTGDSQRQSREGWNRDLLGVRSAGTQCLHRESSALAPSASTPSFGSTQIPMLTLL